MQHVLYDIALPKNPGPIYIVGAGSIVNDAHLPAYKKAGFKVAGIYDLDVSKAGSTAAKFDIPVVFESLDQLIRQMPENSVFDLALPGDVLPAILQELPDRSVVLMQKPMGNDLGQARKILQIARAKELLAGVNFQLRYAPFVHAARRLISDGKIGDLCDVEVNVNVYTPWNTWPFLQSLPRVEILYHSIHYIDMVRSFLGNPNGIYARTIGHPVMAGLASVKSNIMMDYGDWQRATILTNHCHQFGLQHQQSYVKFEGTSGAILINMGLLMDYPRGRPDRFEYVVLEGGEPEWKRMDIEGSWFPDAFIGSMAQVMLAAEETIAHPDNSVEDCIYTMACVEAAYRSSEQGGIRIHDLL